MTVHMSEKIMRPDFQGEFTASILAAAAPSAPLFPNPQTAQTVFLFLSFKSRSLPGPCSRASFPESPGSRSSLARFTTSRAARSISTRDGIPYSSMLL